MPRTKPPSPDDAERRAIAEAVAKDKQAGSKAKEGGSAGTLLGALVVLGLVGGGSYYALKAFHQDDDVKPILPPPPSTNAIDQTKPVGGSSPKGTDVSAGEKAAADLSRSAKRHGSTEEPAAATSAASQGFLSVTCTPDCEIEIDGKPTGKHSPLSSMPISSGKHRLRVVNHQLHLSTTDVVEVAPDQTTSKFYNLVMTK
jgi:hypothetical protein